MKTILLADNESSFLEVRQTFLNKSGFKVLSAKNPQEAKQILLNNNIHLAILDIRLSDDDDKRDQSGLILAKDPQFAMIPKIIMTAYPSIELLTRALTFDGQQLPPAVLFLDKAESLDILLKNIKEAFDKFVKIRWDLKIDENHDKMIIFPAIVSSIEPNLAYEQLSERAYNMRDLFSSIFNEYEHIILEKILWHKRNYLALTVGAYTNNHIDHFIVICGLRNSVKQEFGRLDELTPNLSDYLGVHQEYKESFFYGASRWCISEKEELKKLSSIIKEKNDPLIRSSLDDLIDNALSRWHSRAETSNSHQILAAFYQAQYGFLTETFPDVSFSENMHFLLEECKNRGLTNSFNLTNDHIIIKFTERSSLKLVNPIHSVYDNTFFPFIKIPWSISPGAIDLDTVLVNNKGKAWLTDFSQADLYPIWHDYAFLQNTFYKICLDTIPLMDLVSIERQIHQYRPSGNKFRLEDIESKYRKMVSLLLSIQEKAFMNNSHDQRPYDTCLFFCAMASLQKFAQGDVHRERELSFFLNLLILSAILCEKIEKEKSLSVSKEEVMVKLEELFVDKVADEVRIGDHKVNLTETEYNILRYLYENPGKICSREDIARNALGSISFTNAEDAVINTNLGRMRQKIDPEYLVTVRSKGVMLVVKPGQGY